jgi:hypothetical protein
MANVFADQFRKPVNMKQLYLAGSAPDYSTLSPAGEGPAYIDYTVSGATDVTVYFYSRFGTTVKYDDEEELKKYRMGAYGPSIGLMQGHAPLPQAMLCPVSGEVYTLEQGLKWLVLDRIERYVFEEKPDHAKPQGEPLGYGVNIYHSEDGKSFTRAQASNSYLWRDDNTSLYYEAYVAKVPQQAKHVRVTLNEMAKLHRVGEPKPEDYEPNATYGYAGLALAAVSVYGDSLVVGVPDPIVLPEFPWEDYVRPPAASEGTIVYEYVERPPEESSSSKQQSSSSKQQSSSSKQQSSSSKQQSSKDELEDELGNAPPILDEASEPESRQASSKFTGIISESPERSSRQEAADEPESAWVSGEEYRAAEQPLAPGPPEEAPAEIEIAAAPEEDAGFAKGVTAYIVLASGGLAALVLFKPKN